MTKTEIFGIDKNTKRIIYLFLAAIVAGMFFLLIYLAFLLFNSDSKLVVLSSEAEKIVGLIVMTFGILIGRPVGKKWWQVVYKEKKRGLFLKVK